MPDCREGSRMVDGGFKTQDISVIVDFHPIAAEAELATPSFRSLFEVDDGFAAAFTFAKELSAGYARNPMKATPVASAVRDTWVEPRFRSNLAG
jgi:hypothetical protein